MTVRIVLGTANFGTNYGLRGSGQKAPLVNFNIASDIVASAHDIGIVEIDSALAYGPSQEWISKLAGDGKFLVNSKIIWKGADHFTDYESSLAQIKVELGSCNLHLLQWHNWEKGTSSKENYLNLHSFLDRQQELLFGVTTYGQVSVEDALSIDTFSSIQLEYNMLNQAALKGYLNLRVENRPSLYIRSVLLQGLLTDAPLLDNPGSPKLQEKITQIRELAHEWNLSTQELAIRSVANYVEDCAIVLGAESGQQLQEMNGYIENGPLPSELAALVSKLDSSLEPDVDPRNWVF
jgi:aryl-alcohol dehydrogenase-like predicted oxidoreductase